MSSYFLLDTLTISVDAATLKTFIQLLSCYIFILRLSKFLRKTSAWTNLADWNTQKTTPHMSFYAIRTTYIIFPSVRRIPRRDPTTELSVRVSQAGRKKKVSELKYDILTSRYMWKLLGKKFSPTKGRIFTNFSLLQVELSSKTRQGHANTTTFAPRLS